MPIPAFGMGDEAAIELLRQAAEVSSRALSEITSIRPELDAVKRLAEDNNRLLRGNAKPGLVTLVSHNERTALENKAALEKITASLPDRTGIRWAFWKDVIVAALAMAGPVLAVILSRGGAP